MKRNLFFAACLLSAGTQVQAQFIKKGTVQVGADLTSTASEGGYYVPSRDFSWLKSSLVRIEAGKAIKNNLLLGFRLGAGSTPGYSYYDSGAYFNPVLSQSPVFSAGVWLRKYAPLGKKLSLFAEGSLSYTTSKIKRGGEDYTGKLFIGTLRYHDIDLGLTLGASWAVSRRVNIELAFNNLLGLRHSRTSGSYTYLNTGETYRSGSTQLGTIPGGGTNFTNISLGVRIKLGKLK